MAMFRVGFGRRRQVRQCALLHYFSPKDFTENEFNQENQIQY